MKLIKKIQGGEYGMYQDALTKAGVQFAKSRCGDTDVLEYQAKDGRNIRVEIYARQYDSDGYSESIMVWEV